MAQNIHLLVDSNGNAVNFATAQAGRLSAFGEQLVAQNNQQVYVVFPYAIESGLAFTSGAGTYSITQASGQAVLTTSTGGTDKASLVSRGILQYVPGQGGAVKVTPQFTSGVGAQRQLAGYGDDNDGFFVGMSGSTFGVYHRQFGQEDFVPSGDFTAGLPAGMDLDVSKGNVYGIDFQWLGYGQVDFAIEDPADGRLKVFHSIKYTNQNNVPTIETPSLPIRMEIDNNGETTAATGRVACLQGALQGHDGLSKTFAASGVAESVGGGDEIQILTIRNKTTFNGKRNRRAVVLSAISAGVDGAAEVLVQGFKNAPVGSPSYVDVDTNESVVEVDGVGTVSGITGGFGGSLIGRNSAQNVDLASYNVVLAPGETVSIEAIGLGGFGSVDVYGYLTWKELY